MFFYGTLVLIYNWLWVFSKSYIARVLLKGAPVAYLMTQMIDIRHSGHKKEENDKMRMFLFMLLGDLVFLLDDHSHIFGVYPFALATLLFCWSHIYFLKIYNVDIYSLGHGTVEGFLSIHYLYVYIFVLLYVFGKLYLFIPILMLQYAYILLCCFYFSVKFLRKEISIAYLLFILSDILLIINSRLDSSVVEFASISLYWTSTYMFYIFLTT